MRHGFSSVEGDHVSLEPGSLGCGGGSWLINISTTENHVIIEMACARFPFMSLTELSLIPDPRAPSKDQDSSSRYN